MSRQQVVEQRGDVQAAIEAVAHAPAVVELHDDVKLVIKHEPFGGAPLVQEFDLEKYAEHPRRAVGNATFRDVESFVNYVKRHKGDGTVVFADEAGAMQAVLDHHRQGAAPGWRGLTAKLQRPFLPAYEAWMAAAQQPMGQVEFANFLEERLGEIAAPDAAGLLEAAEEFKAHRTLKFRSQRKLSNGQTQVTYEETVEGGSGSEGQLTLPEVLTVVLQPFRDSEKFSVDVRLRWRLDDGAVKFWLLFDDVKLDEQLHAIYEEALAQVANTTNVLVLRGSDA